MRSIPETRAGKGDLAALVEAHHALGQLRAILCGSARSFPEREQVFDLLEEYGGPQLLRAMVKHFRESRGRMAAVLEGVVLH